MYGARSAVYSDIIKRCACAKCCFLKVVSFRVDVSSYLHVISTDLLSVHGTLDINLIAVTKIVKCECMPSMSLRFFQHVILSMLKFSSHLPEAFFWFFFTFHFYLLHEECPHVPIKWCLPKRSACCFVASCFCLLSVSCSVFYAPLLWFALFCHFFSLLVRKASCSIEQLGIHRLYPICADFIGHRNEF